MHRLSCVQPDITFFGEKLTDDFDESVEKDRSVVDLVLVIGTSLKVSPVSEILCTWTGFSSTVALTINMITAHMPHSVPQVMLIQSFCDKQQSDTRSYRS